MTLPSRRALGAQKGFRVFRIQGLEFYPRAPRALLNFLEQGLGFGALRFEVLLWGSKSLLAFF